MAVATGDYDNNGYADIFVAGVNRNIFYWNRGDRKFEDVTQKAGLTDIHPKYGKMWATSAGWLDYNKDGLLDLLVSNYVEWDPRTEPRCGTSDQPMYCHPDNYRGLPNQLFRNNGAGTFTERLHRIRHRTLRRQRNGRRLRRCQPRRLPRHLRRQRLRPQFHV
jgi:hypothetical protein